MAAVRGKNVCVVGKPVNPKKKREIRPITVARCALLMSDSRSNNKQPTATTTNTISRGGAMINYDL